MNNSPEVGDTVMTGFGDTGTIIKVIAERIQNFGYLYEGTFYNGPYIIQLKGGTVLGLRYDEFRRI